MSGPTRTILPGKLPREVRPLGEERPLFDKGEGAILKDPPSLDVGSLSADLFASGPGVIKLSLGDGALAGGLMRSPVARTSPGKTEGAQSKNPKLSSIMEADHVPDYVAEFIPRIILEGDSTKIEVGWLTDSRSTTPSETLVQRGRDILSRGILRIVAMEKLPGEIFTLFQDNYGNLSIMNIIKGRPSVFPENSHTFLNDGLHVTHDLKVLNAEIKHLATDGLIAIYRAVLSTLEVVQTSRVVSDKMEARPVYKEGLYISKEGAKSPFTFNNAGADRFEPQDPVLPLSTVPDAVLNLAATNVKANGGSGFGGYSPAYLNSKGKRWKNALRTLCRAGVSVIAAETEVETGNSYFLLQDNKGRALLVRQSGRTTMAAAGKLFRGDRLFYSVENGLGRIAAKDKEFTLIVGQRLGEEDEKGFLLEVMRFISEFHIPYYFAEENIYLRGDGRVFRDPILVDNLEMLEYAILGRDQSRSPVSGNVLLVWDGKAPRQANDHRDAEFMISTDSKGTVTELLRELVSSDGKYAVVIRPEPFFKHGMRYDKSGTVENLILVRETSDGLREVSSPNLKELYAEAFFPVDRGSPLLGSVEIEWLGSPEPVTLDKVKEASKQRVRINNTFEVDIFAGTYWIGRGFEGVRTFIEEHLRIAPLRLWEDVKEIYFYEGPADYYGFGAEEIAGHYNLDAHVMRVFNTAQQGAEKTAEIVFHEFGHALLNLSEGPTKGPFSKGQVLTAIVLAGKEVEKKYHELLRSKYFESSWEERLCEALSLYLRDRDGFRGLDEAMTRVIEGFLTFVGGSTPAGSKERPGEAVAGRVNDKSARRKEQIFPPIMSLDELPAKLVKRLSWGVKKRGGSFLLGHSVKETKGPEFELRGREAVENGDVWVIARQGDFYLFQDRSGDVEAFNENWARPIMILFISQGFLVSNSRGLQTGHVEMLAEDDEQRIVRFDGPESATYAIDKNGCASYFHELYVSENFTYNYYGDKKFELVRNIVMPINRLPAEVIELAVRNIDKNGRGTFGKFSPVIKGKGDAAGTSRNEGLVRLRTRDVVVIGVKRTKDGRFFLLQDGEGGVLAIKHSRGETRAVDTVLFEKEGFYYSVGEGLATMMAEDDTYHLFRSLTPRDGSGRSVSGFLMARKAKKIKDYTRHYFERARIFINQERGIYERALIFEGASVPSAPSGTMLLKRTDGRLSPLRGHRDYRRGFITNDEGVVSRMEKMPIPGTKFAVVTSPDEIRFANRQYDRTGTNRNVWVVERNGRTTRELGQDEMFALCPACDKGYKLKLHNMEPLLEPDRVKIDTPKGKVKMFKQDVIVDGKFIIEVHIEASSRKQFGSIFSGVRRFLGRVPDAAWKVSRRIYFYKQSANFYGLDSEEISGRFGRFSGGDIEIFGTAEGLREKTIYHEAGHALIALGSTGRRQALKRDALLAIASGDRGVEGDYDRRLGNYYSYSWEERVCEGLSLFLLDPGFFRSQDLPVARFWDGLLTLFEEQNP